MNIAASSFVLCKISQISSFATHMAFTTWISLDIFSQEFHVSALSNKFQMNIIWGTLKMFCDIYVSLSRVDNDFINVNVEIILKKIYLVSDVGVNTRY